MMKAGILLILASAAAAWPQVATQDPSANIDPPPQGMAAALPAILKQMGGEEKFAVYAIHGDDPLGPVRAQIASTMGAATKLGGLFGFKSDTDISDALCGAFSSSLVSGTLGSMFGNPNGEGPDEKCQKDATGGSGPYKAGYRSTASLANHTIYAPLVPPTEKLPVLVWSNGFCLQVGLMFQNFLTEIASHGFIAIANGGVKGDLNGLDRPQDLINALDWVTSHDDAKKLGNIDFERIAVGGQSCGGPEALAINKDPRIKLSVIFNSGSLGGSQSRMANFSHPIGYFLGGPKDVGYGLGNIDYNNALKAPVLLADVNTGHIGTYYQKSGGKFGKAAVAFLKWQFKGDQESKKLFCEAGTDSALVKAGFRIKSKNGMC